MEANHQYSRIQKDAKTAGLWYLIVIVSSLLALVILDPKIQSITDIEQNQTYFRVNIAYTLFMYIGVIILVTYLYRTLKHINKTLATLGLTLRLAEAILGGVKVLCHLTVLLVLNGENHSSLFTKGQLYALATLFDNAYWEMTTVIFAFLGLGSIAYFVVFLRSQYIPKGISVWGIASYSLVVLGSFITIIFDNNAYMILGSQTIIFEIFIGGWLLFKGIKIQVT